MKSVVYIFTFLVIFLLTTAAIIFLNSNYQNIFEFNFNKPGQKIVKKNIQYSLDKTGQIANFNNASEAKVKSEIYDSLKTLINNSRKYDSVSTVVFRDSTLLDSIKILQEEIARTSAKLDKFFESQRSDTTKQDSIRKTKINYQKWIKQTASMFEAMDPQKAAKILQNYSDNTARDIIYSMRNKKAAEVLAELSPQTAKRITQVQ